MQVKNIILVCYNTFIELLWRAGDYFIKHTIPAGAH